MGFARYLCETGEAEDEERLQYLHVIRDEAERLSDLSQNALLLSKMEALQIITGKEEYDLGEQLRRCAILMLPQIQEKKIDFRSPEETPLPYYGNEEIMEHVWLNLLGNAVKFTPAGGVITVTYGQRDGVIDVRIADSGPGMSEEVRRHIFDRYYQEKGMKSTKGNGIGLAIVKRIVDLCEGEIEVTGGPGEGSCFTVKLPV